MAYTTIDKPTDYFNTKLYTGNGSTQSITGVGFQPDWVWIKQRNGAEWHNLIDSVRGGTKVLYSNETNAEATSSNLITSFDSDGFSLGTASEVNGNTNTFASWNWLAGGTASSNTDGSITSSVSANTTAGFSIVSFTGNGSNDATIGHGLGTTPAMIITKNRDDSVHWRVWHKDLQSTYTIYLSSNLYSFGPTSHSNGYIKTVGSSTYSVYQANVDTNGVNGSGDSMIAYCFAEIKGYSKMGSYTGNGNADGTFVYTGFKPAFIITKASSTGQSWQLYDNKRNTFNQSSKILFPNLSASEQDDSSAAVIDILSNGFKQKVNDAGGNGSGHTYIYMAFAESPFVTSTGIPTTAR